MAKKSTRRKERIDPVPPRNVYKVAQVKEDVARQLPGVFYKPRVKEAAKTSAPRKALTDPGDYRDRGPTQEAPVSTVNQAPERPNRALGVSNPEAARRDEQLRGCKAKPSKTAGNGSSRPFVPWCKK